MALGKQGGMVKAPTSTPVVGKPNGGKSVGGGMTAVGKTVKPIGGNAKKPR